MTPDAPRLADVRPPRSSAGGGPFVHAPEGAKTVYLVTLGAACGPLLAGVVFFGWRAAQVAVLAILGCVLIERLYYRVTRAPALLGRSHGWLTGVLLALTLPAWSPWYVPLVAAAFAIIVGKCIFGGVGHFLWQPALVGRLAVAVMFPLTLAAPFADHPGKLPLLARGRVIVGDVLDARVATDYDGWRTAVAPDGADALLVTPPAETLAGLTAHEPAFSGLADLPPPEIVAGAKPTALTALPPINDLIYGARPGMIGGTCAVVILVAGLYLLYRNYVRWYLPLTVIVAACAALAVLPIRLAGAGGAVETLWLPGVAEGADHGFVYVCYQMLSFELLLAAFFFATGMTSRPVTAGGQVLFAIGIGVLAAVGKLYVPVPVPALMAVLVMNTFTPVIEGLWRPRVFGRRRLALLRRG